MCVFIELKRRCEKEKRPLLEAHCCSVKTVWHHSAVALEKKKGRKKKKTDVLESTYIPCLLWPCVCFPSLPPLFFHYFFLLTPFVSVSFFHTLSWPSGSDPAAYTNRDRYTGENDKNVQREIWMETGEKAEAWETAKRQEQESVFCLKRS